MSSSSAAAAAAADSTALACATAGTRGLAAGSVFAAMDVQLTAAAQAAAGNGSSDASSSTAQDKIQPLGLSCWHMYGHESGFRLNSQEQQQEQHQRKPNSGALVSPFAMAFSCASDASA
jgi:hypothetical protein